MMENSEITKIYEEDKKYLKKEPNFLKWINEHISVIVNQIEQSKTKIEREMTSTDLYKIQKVIKRRISKLYKK